MRLSFPLPTSAAHGRAAWRAACRLAGAALLAVLALLPGVAGAQYPDRSIRLVVPFPAGGGADNLARIIMPRVAQALGKPIVIDNRPGAGGNVGAELVARAAPDGYTLLYGTNGTHSINQTLYGSLRFDPVKDFAPVSRMTLIAALLIVHPEFPVQSVADLIRYARTNPGKVNFASAGNGTTSHLAGELFKTMAGVDIVHVPYRGGALAAADVMSGQVSMMIDVMPNAYPLAKGGRGLSKALHVAAGVATLAVSWWLMQVVFALHYAHAYYARDPETGTDIGGLDFPGKGPPDYWDFLHFAVVIGVAAQTADVAFTDRRLRRLGTGHSLIAFAFNTLIVALAINLVAGLF